MASPIQFFVEDIAFKFLCRQAVRTWLLTVATSYTKTIEELNYIFVSDAYLLRLNQDFLHHDTLTDIITFPHDSLEAPAIGGDIYISIERVRENAEKFGVTMDNELHRVMAHGLLHLVGFGDKGAKAKKEMRVREDAAMAMFQV